MEEKKTKSAIDPTRLKVKHAYLHSSITIPGKIGAETTLSAVKQKGITLTMTPMGLMVEVGGEVALVPSANVKNVVLDCE